MTDRNKAIDGWRGISVLLVILGHLVGYAYGHLLPQFRFRELLAAGNWDRLLFDAALLPLPSLGYVGVTIFFVISGYLITKNMIAEERRSGGVGVPAFYVRRAFRIMPALMVYLAAISGLAASGVVTTSPQQIVQAATFLCDVGPRCSWWLDHTWTLGVEWQFYLVWPLAFVALGRFREAGLVVAVAVLGTAVLLGYALAASFLAIAVGALYATSASFRVLLDTAASPLVISGAAAVIILKPFTLYVPFLVAPLTVAAPFLIALVVFGTLDRHGPFVVVIQSPWLQRAGLISFSLYLWQQPFTGPLDSPVASAAWVPAVLLLASASYWFVERPMIGVGKALSRRITGGQSAQFQSRVIDLDASEAKSSTGC